MTVPPTGETTWAHLDAAEVESVRLTVAVNTSTRHRAFLNADVPLR